jgi:hypothetical protein
MHCSLETECIQAALFRYLDKSPSDRTSATFHTRVSRAKTDYVHLCESHRQTDERERDELLV